MTIDEIIDEVEYYITNPAKWLNYSDKRRTELKMMIEGLLSQNNGKPHVLRSLPPTCEGCGNYTAQCTCYDNSKSDFLAAMT